MVKEGMGLSGVEWFLTANFVLGAQLRRVARAPMIAVTRRGENL